MSAPIVHATDGARERPRIVVVGTGHAGLEAVRALHKADADVLLVDRNNYHKFQPLLYQVATAGLMEGQITQPARHIFQDQDNFEFRMAQAVGVDFDARELLVEPGPPVGYDYLILAAGASTAYFGVEGAQEFGFPLKNIPDAINLRSRILERFEAASANPALIEEGALRFVIVGGGATGIETAGALVELIGRVLSRDFHALDVSRAEVILIEMTNRLLAGYKQDLADYTRRELERRGVEVRLETSVARVTPSEVHLESGEVIPTHTLVWAAGVRANPLADELGVEQARAGRVVVDECLRIPGRPEVFVAGDMAGAVDEEGRLYPQVAQVAIQQGIHAARCIRRALHGEPSEPFRYRDRGTMATIGRNAAVVQFPSGFAMKGWFAWLIWVFVHIVQLIGLRNRWGVLSSWFYNYLTWDRGPRLILTSFPESDEVPHDRPVLTTSPTHPGPDGSLDPHLTESAGQGASKYP
jgi:NADH:ubiquinone reductase (H+-translocating)